MKAAISLSTNLSTVSIPSSNDVGQAQYRRPSLKVSDPALTVESAGVRGAKPIPISSTPQLTPPKKVRFAEMDMIHVLDEIHASGELLTSSFTRSISDGSKRLRELSLENIEKLKEAAERAKESGFWSLLQKIGECILAAITSIFGISLVATGAGSGLGAVLIASGVLTLANFAMRETGSWDYVARQLASSREDQRKLATYLPIGTSILSAVLGMGGTAAAALWTTLNMTQKAMSIAQVTMAVYEGTVTTGRGFAEARALWTQGDLAQIESNLSLERIGFEDRSQGMQTLHKVLRQIQESAEQVIDLAGQAYRNVRIQV